MLEYWIMFPAGLVISTLAMFSGLGGGVFWMPFLLSVTGLSPHQAVVTTLLIQLFGQGSATVANHNNKFIDWKLVIMQAKAGAPAAAAGAVLSMYMQPVMIKFLLGIVIFFIAYVFLRGDDFFEKGGEHADMKAAIKGRPITTAGGILTGFLGIGVGDWLVPFFNKQCHLSMVRSVSTAIALMMLLSASALSTYLSLGAKIPWSITLPGIAGVIAGAQIGARLLKTVSEVRFKEIFVLMLVFLATHVTFNAF